MVRQEIIERQKALHAKPMLERIAGIREQLAAAGDEAQRLRHLPKWASDLMADSGIYLRGRHEVQIEDSGNREPESIHLGGIYGFLAPNQVAAKAPGEWQRFDITLIGRRVTVVLNGTPIIVDQTIPGITGGALDSNEGEPGPIYLQGDHTAVEFRRIVIQPAKAGPARD